MRKTAFIISPVLASAVTGGLTWFLGGAITGVLALYAASAAAGALIGILVAIGPSRAVDKELTSLREKAIQTTRAEEKSRIQPDTEIHDVRELREFVAGLTRALKTAEEIEAMRSTELERAVHSAASGLSEVERLIEAIRQKIADIGRILAEAEGGNNSGFTTNNRSRY